MASVIKWSHSHLQIAWGKGILEYIYVDSAVFDTDVYCSHCGKIIKAGKLGFCGSGYISLPHLRGDNYWGDSYQPTFCSPNHAKLFAKGQKGL